MSVPAPIAIIGAGSWGTALALVLARNHIPVQLYGNEPDVLKEIDRSRCNSRYLPDITLPSSIKITTTLAACLQGVNDVLIVVPSNVFQTVLQEIKLHASKDCRIAWASKGIVPQGNRLLHDVVQTIFPGSVMAVISGPSFAKEVAKQLPTAVSVAASDDAYAKFWQQQLNQKTFRVYRNNDLIGVQCGGAVKNVLAIATGISDGLGYGANSRCAILTRGLAEMVRLGLAMGAKQKTFMGLSGVGDLMLTGTDDQSRNRRFGKALGQGKTVDEALKQVGQVVEGAHNAKQVMSLAKRYQVLMPICEMVHNIIEGVISIDDAIQMLMGRKVDIE